MRAQPDSRLDGIDQGGRFYVFEVDDQGEFGVWRRDLDHWVEMQPWTLSAAVRPGDAENVLTVRAFGPRLTFLVNGTRVFSRKDATLAQGAVGVYAGGDLNQVEVDRVVVRTAAGAGSVRRGPLLATLR